MNIFEKKKVSSECYRIIFKVLGGILLGIHE